tara:strand:- start:958 stop:1938 length:981 start_codon:yes stop_codon:yes gene_type:complete
MQAEGSDSDCALRPVLVAPDPTRSGSLLVLCEVFNTDLSPHPSNTRSRVRSTLGRLNEDVAPRIGFEQEYTLMKIGSDGPECTPIGWPSEGQPNPQGRYYCSVGPDTVSGRQFSENHLDVCLNAGLALTGTNAEVMLGQWEYQVGGPDVHSLSACDHLILSRFLLHRVAERFGAWVCLDPKPVEGDWNGSGLHSNFSTSLMRAEGGMSHIEEACNKLSQNTEEHLSVYGEGIERRLTGEHETASYKEFSFGVSDRGASVRIPWHVAKNGFGYLEDRRPNSNADPYLVLNALLSTICVDNNESSSEVTLEEARAILAKQGKALKEDG